MIPFPVAIAAAIVVHGCVAVHAVPLPLGDTNAPLTVSGPGMQVFALHRR
jgi:hypothetical protein